MQKVPLQGGCCRKLDSGSMLAFSPIQLHSNRAESLFSIWLTFAWISQLVLDLEVWQGVVIALSFPVFTGLM